MFQISEDWTSLQIVGVMLENWSVHSKGFSPLFWSFFFPLSKHITVCAILSVKKVKSKHIRNERTQRPSSVLHPAGTLLSMSFQSVD